MKAKPFKNAKDSDENKSTAVPTDEESPLSKYLDGMGTATARILIERHLDDGVFEKYGLEGFKNTGRYYIAKIVAANGQPIDEVLIDKQSGMIQSLRLKSRTEV